MMLRGTVYLQREPESTDRCPIMRIVKELVVPDASAFEAQIRAEYPGLLVSFGPIGYPWEDRR